MNSLAVGMLRQHLKLSKFSLDGYLVVESKLVQCNLSFNFLGVLDCDKWNTLIFHKLSM